MTLKTLFPLFLLFLALSGAPSPVHGAQLNFGTVESSTDLTFNYTFRDYQFRQQHLTFSLPKSLLKKDFKSVKPTESATMNDRTIEGITAYLDGLKDDGVTYKITRQENGFKVQMTGQNISQERMNAIKAAVERIKQKSSEDYLRENYMMNHPLQRNTLMPDYRRVIETNTKLLSLVSQRIGPQLRGSNTRDKINYTLNFLQTIPYDSFTRIEPPKGLGYVTPGTLLMMNRGDCESKTIAAAGMFKSLIPQIPMAAIVIPKHVLLGIALPPQTGDETITDNGITYILSEPTGSRVLPLGIVFPESKRYLKNKDYIVQKL